MSRQVRHPRKVRLHCIPKTRDTHSSDERKLRIRRNVEFSSATEGQWTQPRGNLSPQKRNQGMWIFPKLKLGVKKRKPVAYETAAGKPYAPSKSDCQGGPKAERIEWSTYTCLQPQFTIRKQYSRPSGGSTDENTMTLCMIWT